MSESLPLDRVATTRRLSLLALAALALAGCGRRGRPEPPPDADPNYPRIYPTR